MEPLAVSVVIPTYNRANGCLARAIEGALAQSYAEVSVIVVDDGSTDNTAAVTRRYASEPRFSCIKLGRNLGTAQAKNIGMLCSRYDAITFHDSDDSPHVDKVLLQARALGLHGHVADSILNWEPFGYSAGEKLSVDIAVGAYDLIKMDGSVHYINKRVSLLDDFFPQLQFPSKTEGDWCLVNCGLFRRSIFEKLGGFLDSVEEDRELRNRTIAAGCIYYFIDQPLLTKIEMGDSLTMQDTTGYRGHARHRDREEVWRRVALYQGGRIGPRVATDTGVCIDLSSVIVEEVINPGNLAFQESIPATPGTRAALRGIFNSQPAQQKLANRAITG
ncbi:MAG TPA: glycosyltransferase family 2 protein [Woeseiaceae bacterium]|nr:glycosyltransferase family 2 protein [Woeseiaceae bacterium]